MNEFSDDINDLKWQINWLLNEIDYAYTLINENNMDEAKQILKKEFKDHY